MMFFLRKIFLVFTFAPYSGVLFAPKGIDNQQIAQNSNMKIVRTVEALRQEIASAKRDGSVGFIPTMGALHSGHMSLVERARKENDFTVVSLFVNPTQFNDKSDLASYPRTEESDVTLLEGAGCDLLFAPSVEEVYPETDTRTFDFGTLESVMEGEHRPGHFNGVAQVVSKLFDFVTPTRAYFGEKDFQQLAIIRKMNESLGLGIEIVGCEIFRDERGLALSSRNALLTNEELEVAPTIYLTMVQARKAASLVDLDTTKKWTKEQIECVMNMEVEYFDIVDSSTLRSLNSMDESKERRACIAVKLGKVRLIDNIAF